MVGHQDTYFIDLSRKKYKNNTTILQFNITIVPCFCRPLLPYADDDDQQWLVVIISGVF